MQGMIDQLQNGPSSPENVGQPQEGQPQGEMQKPDDPKLEREIEGFVGAIAKMMHGGDSKASVYETLKSAPPEMSIPTVATQLTFLVAKSMQQQLGEEPSLEALFGGLLFATSEAAEIGEAGGFFEEEITPEGMKPIVQKSLQMGIENGVKQQLIDPIELQEKIEPLLSDAQRQMGLEAGRKTGVPAEAGTSHAMEAYANQKMREKQSQISAQGQAKGQSALRQSAAQAQGGA